MLLNMLYPIFFYFQFDILGVLEANWLTLLILELAQHNTTQHNTGQTLAQQKPNIRYVIKINAISSTLFYVSPTTSSSTLI